MEQTEPRWPFPVQAACGCPHAPSDSAKACLFQLSMACFFSASVPSLQITVGTLAASRASVSVGEPQPSFVTSISPDSQVTPHPCSLGLAHAPGTTMLLPAPLDKPASPPALGVAAVALAQDKGHPSPGSPHSSPCSPHPVTTALVCHN